jgi:small subunit ribosomal protein S9
MAKKAVKPIEEQIPLEVPVPLAEGMATESTTDEMPDDYVIPKEKEETADGKERYYESVGRRKESIARVRLYTKKSTDVAKDDEALMTVNGKEYVAYFGDVNLIAGIESPLRKLKSLNRFKVSALVSGGGIAGQAGALRHGLARALELFDTNFRKKLKKSGFLTRDSREKERRKYGRKRKARKGPQWSKR